MPLDGFEKEAILLTVVNRKRNVIRRVFSRFSQTEIDLFADELVVFSLPPTTMTPTHTYIYL